MLFGTSQKIKSDKPVYVYHPTDTGSRVYRHRIKIGDRLVIRFLNNYDLGVSAAQSATSSANNTVSDKGYLVNYDSTVILPLVGRLNLIGLTRLEASRKLEQEFSKFVVNPIIDVNIANLGVTILGEVNSQGKIYVDKENTTLVDVIALAGGFKDSGKKKNIKIIRGQEIIIVNLKKIESLYSSSIVMQDNDIIYVEPYNIKAATEPYMSIQPALTIITTTLSTIILISQFYLIYNK